MRIKRRPIMASPSEDRVGRAELESMPEGEFRQVVSALLFDYLDSGIIRTRTPDGGTAYEIKRVRLVAGRLGRPPKNAKPTHGSHE
jgi:hypothetical protein